MSEKKIQQGIPPTEEVKFYKDWARESQKNNIKLMNDVLSKMITLNSAFAGGAIVQTVITSTTNKIFLTLIFIVALIVSFYGFIPYQGEIKLNTPQTIKNHKSEALAHKRKFVILSAFLMIIGFSFSLVFILLQK